MQNSLFVFVGNTLFLQTILVPVCGSNGPLLSLAYEFWYYALSPVALAVFIFRRQLVPFSASAALLLLMIWFLPNSVLAGSLIWLAGAIAVFASPFVSRFIVSNACLLSFAGPFAILATMIIAEYKSVEYSDLLLGCTVALFAPVFTLMPGRQALGQKFFRGLAEISYTLYVTHFRIWMAATRLSVVLVRFVPSVGVLGFFSYTSPVRWQRLSHSVLVLKGIRTAFIGRFRANCPQCQEWREFRDL